MISIENTEIERLKSGDFSNITLSKWFKDYSFSYIFAVVDGCDKKLDFDILNLVSKYAECLLIKPNTKGWDKKSLKELIMNSNPCPVKINELSQKELISYWENTVVRICERILQEVILVCSRHSEYCGDIMERLSKNSNANIRLYCCANGNYNNFFNDSSQRVRKVANIRYNFEQKWNDIADNDEEKERIIFLTSALKNDLIHCLDGEVPSMKEDKMFAIFFGELLQGQTWYHSFDRDIVFAIEDKRILADEINKLVKEGKIIFKNGVVPDCFSQIEDGSVLKKKKI